MIKNSYDSICVFPDDCPVRTIRSTMSGFQSIDKESLLLSAKVSIALNGQDFVESNNFIIYLMIHRYILSHCYPVLYWDQTQGH